MPVGVFAAVVARDEALAVAGVLPLVALLAVFARERTGRIENAMELQRIAQEGQDRLQSIVQNASDLIAIVRADGTMSTVAGSVDEVFGPVWETVQGTSFARYIHPDDTARVQAFLAGWPTSRQAILRSRSGGCATPTDRGATCPPWRPTCSPIPGCTAWSSRPATSTRARRSRSSSVIGRSTTP